MMATELRQHRFTMDENERVDAAGVLSDDVRAELLEGRDRRDAADQRPPYQHQLRPAQGASKLLPLEALPASGLAW